MLPALPRCSGWRGSAPRAPLPGVSTRWGWAWRWLLWRACAAPCLQGRLPGWASVQSVLPCRLQNNGRMCTRSKAQQLRAGVRQLLLHSRLVRLVTQLWRSAWKAARGCSLLHQGRAGVREPRGNVAVCVGSELVGKHAPGQHTLARCGAVLCGAVQCIPRQCGSRMPGGGALLPALLAEAHGVAADVCDAVRLGMALCRTARHTGESAHVPPTHQRERAGRRAAGRQEWQFSRFARPPAHRRCAGAGRTGAG